jgi:short subunit dehydrogenase-like uncharacterized protein
MGKAGFSKGTASTMVVNLGKGSAVRENGKIKVVPVGHKTKWMSYNDKKYFFMTIPWGDVSTAYYSTGIPNIETYTGTSPKQFKMVKRLKYINWFLRLPFVRKRALDRLRKGPAGPTPEERKDTDTFIWGEISNDKGELKQAQLITPNGYTLTALSSLIIAKKILNGNVKPGFQTPSNAYGEDLILEVEGTSREDL